MWDLKSKCELTFSACTKIPEVEKIITIIIIRNKAVVY